MKIVVGLGNPGKKYSQTRHNIGFMVLDALVDKKGWKESTGANLIYAQDNNGEEEVEYIKPTTFMNNSGVAVAYAIKKHPQAKLIVVHDDKDIPLGKIKIQTDRSAGGHNGVKSIIEHLGTQNFTRIRIGIAPLGPKSIEDTAEFVLDKFTAEEKNILEETISTAALELKKILNSNNI